MDKSENELIEDMDFSVFEHLFRDVMPENIDIHFMNKKNVPDDIKKLFNKTLLKCKEEFDTPLLLILVELSEHYIDAKFLPDIINSRVRWELMEEIKNRHSFVNKHYYNNILLDYFF